MRILIHHRIASRDGQSVHIDELIAALERKGHETLLVGPRGLIDTAFGGTNRSIEWIKRITPKAVYEFSEIAYNIKAFLRLRAAVQSFCPDVIYERFNLFLFAGIWVSRLYRLPLLLEVNSPLYEERTANGGLRLRLLARWAQCWLWRQADHLLPVSGVLARTINEYGVSASRISVVPNGVNTNRFKVTVESIAAKTVLGLPQRTVIGFIGFIRAWNAIHHLIDFVAAHSPYLDVHILVVGDGPARRSLEEYAYARGVSERLTISGVVSREQVGRYITAFDVAVIPGLTPYSSPLKLFEYLQLGRAVVAPDTENIREILTDERNALLFHPDIEGDLEAALLRLCRDPRLRSRLGSAARETIFEKALTWDHNAQRVTDIAQALLTVSPPKYPARAMPPDAA